MQRSLALRVRFCAAVVLIVAAGMFYQFMNTPGAQAAGVSQAGRSLVRGHIAPSLRHATVLGPTPASRVLSLSIVLAPRNSAQLTALIAAQNDPHSPFYHQYITSGDYDQTFAPSAATVNSVVAYLHGQGLTVGAIAPNHLLIDVSGTVGVVERAFGVTIDDYSLSGRTVYAPASEPSVPSALANAIVSVGGLDDVSVNHPLDVRSTQSNTSNTAHAGSGPGGGYTPSELRTAYDMNSLISSDNGADQTVAIFELDGYKSADVNQYLSFYGLGSTNYSNVLVDGATNTAGAGAIEVELDMEDVSAIAPGATQKIYIGPNTTQGVNDTYNKIVTDDVAKTVSTSWGLCEADTGNSELAAEDTIFQEAAVQGQAIFAAAGDSGAYDCGDTNLGVDNPADDPNVVGVGGTSLTTGSGGSYTSETVWSCAACTGNGSAMGEGGGGGLSAFFSQPSYQSGPGVSNSFSNGKREVPDVSADADPNTGYSMYCTVGAAGCPSSGWLEIGGTSAAAPLWTAVATDTNEYLAGQGKTTLGSASAMLYRLFNTAQSLAAYHDITTGTNLFYPATAGYDLATGIGTPDVWNFAQDAAGNSGSGGGGSPPTITSFTPTSGPVGTSVTITGTNFTGTTAVAFNGASASFAVNSGTSITATVPTGATTGTVSVTNGSGAATSSGSFTVTTTPPNDFSISAAPTSLSIAQGGNGTSTINTAVTSGSAGTVSLTAGVAPSGPTAALKPTSVTAGNSSTLTITVGSSVAAGSYTVTVTGAEGSATHSTTVTVTVTAVHNDFSISASPTSLSISQGRSGTSTISTRVTSGSAGTVSFRASVSPSGPTAAFTVTSVRAGNATTLVIRVGANVATGTYRVTVTGTEGSATHSVMVTITVIARRGRHVLTESTDELSLIL